MVHQLLKINRLITRIHSNIKPFLLPFLVITLIFGVSLILTPLINVIKDLGLNRSSFFSITKSPKDLLVSTDNLTNLLFLGVRGEGSDSPDLTDTIIVVSYNHATGTTTLLSIPRDLYVTSLKTKINSVFHYGNLQKEGGGITLIKAAIQETLGIPVHYTAIINFQGFINVIDALGGIEIDVERSFTDNKYPLPGMENAFPESKRFETISFSQGKQMMDGATALKFVRSRQAEGEEGSDFARSKRQELLISALKRKILSPDILLHPAKINSLLDTLNQNFSSDIDPNLYPSFGKIALALKDSPLVRLTLSTTQDNSSSLAILEKGKPADFNNQWVLTAKDDNWSALRQYVTNKLKGLQ